MLRWTQNQKSCSKMFKPSFYTNELRYVVHIARHRREGGCWLMRLGILGRWWGGVYREWDMSEELLQLSAAPISAICRLHPHFSTPWSHLSHQFHLFPHHRSPWSSSHHHHRPSQIWSLWTHHRWPHRRLFCFSFPSFPFSPSWTRLN